MTPEPTWHQATQCTGGNCIQTAHHNGQILIRDSKNPHQQPLQFTPAEWDAFTTGIRNGDFDNLTNE